MEIIYEKNGWSLDLLNKDIQTSDSLWMILYRDIDEIRRIAPKLPVIHKVSFSFIPILADLNGKKTVLKKEFIECLNPDLPIKVKQAWEVFMPSQNYLDSEYVDFVCKKYAKFYWK